MITIKNEHEIALMKKAGAIVKDALCLAEEKIKPGMTTYELNRLIHEFIVKQGAHPSFLNYNGFPASSCISIDDVVVHGIPSKKTVICEGMLVSVDVGAMKDGFHGDAARTFAVGEVSAEKRQLMEVTKQSFFEATAILKNGMRVGDIGNAVYNYATKFGYGVVREMIGHGIGTKMHELPDVPNYGEAGRGVRLVTNMTICIEPMINLGTEKITFDEIDGWTVRTADGKPSAHYENTVIIKEDGVEYTTL
ncbi:MAG: type I methionyl aminopeptidase [Clostridia bacterium]|nr:type I methionyl aminopeptidase [Clostridia bacterium]